MIHLSYDDFCRLTPIEFEHIYKAYQEKCEAGYKDEWTRMRMLAAIVIQPHLKHKVTPEKLLPFPWEKFEKQRKSIPELTAAESLERFKKIVKKVEA